MARQQVFSIPTKLWHPAEGWREFPAGETDPGGAWHEKEGGGAVGDNAAAGAMKDLIEANDRIDQMGQLLASKDHDLAVMAKERDEAVLALAAAQQGARDAEAARSKFEDIAADLTGERDRARAEAEALTRRIGEIEAEQAAETARADGLAQQLADANAEIAKVDGDKDGKVGGSTKKP